MALLPHSYFRFVALGNETAWQKLERTICESHLPTSVIADFNDPFESGPILFGDKSERISIEVMGAFELQFVGAILFWKSEDWAYEQEARLVTGSNETAIPFPSQELPPSFSAHAAHLRTPNELDR
jgi:hypothetical protein